ncbi:unnamed protein product [Rhizophagus irregularis]|nr:unnamed protein product [Rhizophagus irregularis]
MLAYLLEYYSENSIANIGWMINVTKILSELPANYVELLYYKPCFGGIKYNFPNKRFKELSVSEETLNLKVYVLLTQLRSSKSFEFFKIQTNKSRGKFGKILHWLRKALIPPGYKNLSDNEFSPFLRIH